MPTTDVSKILFIDIETVPITSSMDEMGEELAQLWNEKYRTIQKRFPEKYTAETTASEAFALSAGIYAEFGRIICISAGYFYTRHNTTYFRTKSFAGHDEQQILKEFADLLTRFCSTNDHTLCGHNIREFDIPYMCRRMLINGIELPQVLQLNGKKPWEVNFIDTLELWKFGDYKNYTSLKVLTAIFGIPTPKDDIDGSQVAAIYYQSKDVERIRNYCQKDVVATAQVYLRLHGQPTIPTANIEML